MSGRAAAHHEAAALFALKGCSMGDCYIITPLADEGAISKRPPKPGDLILCADGGYMAAKALLLKPDLLIGDFDSLQSNEMIDCPIWRVPKEKDETDSFLCVQKGVEMGATRFFVVGGLGGRLDHTFANIQLMAWGADRHVTVTCVSAAEEARLLTPGEHAIAQAPGAYLSFFAYSPKVTGLTLQAVQYPLTNAVIDNRFPLCVSNRFLDGPARVTFTEGLLLLIVSAMERL